MLTRTYPYTYKQLTRTEVDDVRHYDVGEDRPLPSVTTILSAVQDHTWLTEWRERVGDKEADRIVAESVLIGNNMHDNLERYALSDPLRTGPMISKIFTDTIIKKGLCNVNEVWGIEAPLYYPGLYAGTTDLVGRFKGTPAVMDYKNSRQDKTRDDVEDYFLQLAAYGAAHNKVHGTNIQKGVIFMMCRSGKYCEFIIEGDEYLHYEARWFDALYQYYEAV